MQLQWLEIQENGNLISPSHTEITSYSIYRTYLRVTCTVHRHHSTVSWHLNPNHPVVFICAVTNFLITFIKLNVWQLKCIKYLSSCDDMCILWVRYLNKMLSYRRETALQGTLQFSPKVEDWNWQTIFYGHYRSIFNHCHIIGLKICRIP